MNDEFETDGYHRDEERENIVRLFNAIVERTLTEKWAPERDDSAHKKAARLYSAGALRAWIPFAARAPARRWVLCRFGSDIGSWGGLLPRPDR